jgi:hypothetical protein
MKFYCGKYKFCCTSIHGCEMFSMRVYGALVGEVHCFGVLKFCYAGICCIVILLYKLPEFEIYCCTVSTVKCYKSIFLFFYTLIVSTLNTS